MKENHAYKAIALIISFAVIILIAKLLASCSAPEHLLEPDKRDFMIIEDSLRPVYLILKVNKGDSTYKDFYYKDSLNKGDYMIFDGYR